MRILRALGRLLFICVILGRCATPGESPEIKQLDATNLEVSNGKLQTYYDCLDNAAKGFAKTPATATEIAEGSHSRCFSEFNDYKSASHEYYARHRIPYSQKDQFVEQQAEKIRAFGKGLVIQRVLQIRTPASK